MARAAGEEEICCGCAGLAVERRRVAPFAGHKGIILVAIARLANSYGDRWGSHQTRQKRL